MSKKKRIIGSTILITIAFFLLLGVVSITTGILYAESIKKYELETYCWINAAAQAVLSIGVLFVMKKARIWDSRDFTANRIASGMYAGLVGIIFSLFMFSVNFFGNLSYTHTPDMTYLFACIFIAFTTGLFEEVLVRGYAYNNFKNYFGNSVVGVKKSIVWSSVLFGVMHIVNLSGYDLASILTTASQVISAIIIGMFFALVYVKVKSLWAVIIIHALMDGATFLLYSLLSPEAFQLTKEGVLSTGEIIIQTFVMPLIMVLPFLIAVIIKWRKLKTYALFNNLKMEDAK